MNSKTAGYFRKLTDTNGQYIWQQSLALGNPATINRYKMMIDENVPDIAAGAKEFSSLSDNFEMWLSEILQLFLIS